MTKLFVIKWRPVKVTIQRCCCAKSRWKKGTEHLFLIEEIFNEQSMLDSVDVSKKALEGKKYYSSQAFEKLSRLLNSSVGTGNIKREYIEKDRSDLLNEEPAVSYRLERMQFFF